MSNKKMRSRFSPPKPVHPVLSGESLTQQNMAKDQDINNMVSRYIKGGARGPLGNPTNNAPARFGDFSSIDFHSMLNSVTDVEQQFQSLPSRLRKRFNNQPYNLIRWTENPENREEAIKLGLITPTENELDSIHDRMAAEADKEAEEAAKPPERPDPEENSNFKKSSKKEDK